MYGYITSFKERSEGTEDGNERRCCSFKDISRVSTSQNTDSDCALPVTTDRPWPTSSSIHRIFVQKSTWLMVAIGQDIIGAGHCSLSLVRYAQWRSGHRYICIRHIAWLVVSDCEQKLNESFSFAAERVQLAFRCTTTYLSRRCRYYVMHRPTPRSRVRKCNKCHEESISQEFVPGHQFGLLAADGHP